ncbi:MAG: HlyD family secretion protein [Verrucomicrobia bacterium]|nr:HlyD family secretion protein [Verrucomicrobiota bacterium]
MSNGGVSDSRDSQDGPSDNFGDRLDRIAAALERQNEISQKHAGDGNQEKDKGDRKGGEGEKKQGGGEKKKGLIQKIGGKRTLIIVGAIILLIVIFFGVRYWMYASSHETTDDAYTAGHTHQISPRVTGTVEEVLVDDNWYVKAGQPLVRLDPSDYQVALQRAQAQLEQSQGQALQARATVAQAAADLKQRQAQVTQSNAQVGQASAQLEIAQINFDRNSQLFQRDMKAVAKADVDSTKATLDSARANLEAAKATVDSNAAAVETSKADLQSAQAQLQSADAAVAAAKAAVANAELQLAYCTIPSPVNGRIAQKSAEPGNQVQPGGALMAVVEDNVWVLANLKETQLKRVQIGQSVEVNIDAIPSHTFTGRVDSLQPGSGSNFALLPPDNATGNFIKIVQRIPVKIVFDPESIRDFKSKIVPGLSAEPSIDVSNYDEKHPRSTQVPGTERQSEHAQ